MVQDFKKKKHFPTTDTEWVFYKLIEFSTLEDSFNTTSAWNLIYIIWLLIPFIASIIAS